VDPSLRDPSIVSSLVSFLPWGDDSELPFTDSNHNLFVVKISEEKVKTYIKHYGGSSNYSWLWKGVVGKI